MSDGKRRRGRGAPFFAGVLVGSVVSGAVVYLMASSEGKRLIRSVGQRMVATRKEGTPGPISEETAGRRPIDLAKLRRFGRRSEHEAAARMIPISRD